MKLHLIHPPGRALVRGFALAATALLLASASASAALRSYTATWSGAPFANSAQAVGQILIDDARLQNPGDSSGTIGADSAVVAVSVTVTGAGAGNGQFGTAELNYTSLSILDELDLDIDWVGQPQPSDDTTWGDEASGNHYFYLYSTYINPAAPTSSNGYTLVTEEGNGLEMKLISFVPSPISGSDDLNTGEPVAGIPGATVSVLYPTEIAPDGDLFLRAKIRGKGVNGSNDDMLLRWTAGIAVPLLREGSTFFGTVKSFGDPVYHQGTLTVAAKLSTTDGTASPTNDDILVRLPAHGGEASIALREGDYSNSNFGGSIFKFDWIHPVDGGALVGILVDTGEPKKRAAVYDLLGGFCVVTVGDEIFTGSGEEPLFDTITAISRPTAARPAGWQTRVGNDHSVTLKLTTANRFKLLRNYHATPPDPDFLATPRASRKAY